MKQKKRIVALVAAALLVLFVVWMIWGNVALTVTEYSVTNEKIPQSFSGFRIAQVSDLHNAEFGKDNRRLLAQLKKADPDIIVLTGDLIDSQRTNVEIAVDFAHAASEIAPTYYVTGNHENRVLDEYLRLKDGLVSAGVFVLENEKIELAREGDAIALVGLHDPAFAGAVTVSESEEFVSRALSELTKPDSYDVVLAHRPQYYSEYKASHADLVLSGHFHGGQFRLPFIGGLYAPSQGFFPEYDGGIYAEEQTVMVVSRGVGNSSFPIRFNNPPEIVLVELVKEE